MPNDTNEDGKTFTWRIPEVEADKDYTSEKYSVSLFRRSRSSELHFHLQFEIRSDDYELFMVNACSSEETFKVSLCIDSNDQRRRKAPFIVTLPTCKKESLSCGNIKMLFGRKRKISRPSVTITLNVFNVIFNKPNFAKVLDGTSNVDMENAFEKEIGADLTVVCRPSEAHLATSSNNAEPQPGTCLTGERMEFRVQRGILMGRSKVFEAMFSANFAENTNSRLTIDDMSTAALKEFLRFLYCDKAYDIKTHAEELLIAANKYDVPRLKLICEEILCQDLDEGKAIERVILLHRHEAKEATHFLVDEIAHNFSVIIKSDKWKLVCSDLDVLNMIHRRVGEVMESQAREQHSPDVSTTDQNNFLSWERLRARARAERMEFLRHQPHPFGNLN